jgi:predicted phage tail protein
MVIIAVFAAIVGGLSWVQQKFFSESKKTKTVFLIIEILLYLGLSMVSTGVWQNAAP